MLFVVLCPGTPEGSTGNGSGFKASQKTGQRLKVSYDRLGEARNRTCDPWFTRHRFIPYTTAASFLFLWPRSLAVPVLAWWVYVFCGSMSRHQRESIYNFLRLYNRMVIKINGFKKINAVFVI